MMGKNIKMNEEMLALILFKNNAVMGHCRENPTAVPMQLFYVGFF